MDHYFYQNSGTNWTFEMVFNKAHWNINTFSLIFGTHFNERKTSSNVLSEWMFSEWLNFVWNLTCWNIGRRVLLLDHMAAIISGVLHIYEIRIVCPCVYVTYIVYWALNVQCQQLNSLRCWCQHQPNSLPNKKCFDVYFAHWILYRGKAQHIVSGWHITMLSLWWRHTPKCRVWYVKRLQDHGLIFFLILTSRSKNKTVFLRDTAPSHIPRESASDVERIM